MNTGSMHSTEGTQIQKGVFLVSSAGLVLATWLADRAYQTEAPDWCRGFHAASKSLNLIHLTYCYLNPEAHSPGQHL